MRNRFPGNRSRGRRIPLGAAALNRQAWGINANTLDTRPTRSELRAMAIDYAELAGKEQ